MKNIVTICIAMLLITASCNKTKKASNRLDGGEWKVTVLSVDGTSETELPTWKIDECDPYKKSCVGKWQSSANAANFVWQFKAKGKSFEISNQSRVDEATEGKEGEAAEKAEALVYQCQNFSGIYEVVESKKKSMEFKSKVTKGFFGKAVILKLEKK